MEWTHSEKAHLLNVLDRIAVSMDQIAQSNGELGAITERLVLNIEEQREKEVV
jgi:hypothetical protein